jgi:hypothetical protein
MPEETKEIEVEVVEIDGIAPVARPDHADEIPRRGGDWQDWRQWQGRVTKLDSRWWPLWVFLGIIALGLMLTVGMVIAVVFVIVRLCARLVRAVFR